LHNSGHHRAGWRNCVVEVLTTQLRHRERLGLGPDDSEMAEHYREQAARLRIMALVLPGAELKADLRAAARMYEGFAKELEKPARQK
jgi:hypothetical protein